MKKLLTISGAALVVACATPYKPQEVEAVRDYVAVAELEPVDQIRLSPNNQMSYTYVNDYFVIIPSRRDNYLVELRRECRELRQTQFTYDMVDQRRDSSVLRSRIDTIRGCQIGTFYEVSDEQMKELKNLGDAPGEEVFLPDNDD